MQKCKPNLTLDSQRHPFQPLFSDVCIAQFHVHIPRLECTYIYATLRYMSSPFIRILDLLLFLLYEIIRDSCSGSRVILLSPSVRTAPEAGPTSAGRKLVSQEQALQIPLSSLIVGGVTRPLCVKQRRLDAGRPTVECPGRSSSNLRG